MQHQTITCNNNNVCLFFVENADNDNRRVMLLFSCVVHTVRRVVSIVTNHHSSIYHANQLGQTLSQQQTKIESSTVLAQLNWRMIDVIWVRRIVHVCIIT